MLYSDNLHPFTSADTWRNTDMRTNLSGAHYCWIASLHGKSSSQFVTGLRSPISRVQITHLVLFIHLFL